MRLSNMKNYRYISVSGSPNLNWSESDRIHILSSALLFFNVYESTVLVPIIETDTVSGQCDVFHVFIASILSFIIL
jgi:hypothetical protein